MPLAGHGLRPTALRRRAGRPQLKRDPLGSKPTMRQLVARSLAVLLLASCGGRSSDRSTVDTVLVFTAPPPAAPGAPVLRISITRDAKLYADGRPITLTALDSSLRALKGANGGVWLYQEVRDLRRGSALDSAFKTVASSIARHELPVRFARQPDFSDLSAADAGARRHRDR